jgi:hypothetical protein
VQKPELGVGKTPGFDSLVSAHSRPSRCSLTVVRAELNFWSAGGWFYEMVGPPPGRNLASSERGGFFRDPPSL